MTNRTASGYTQRRLVPLGATRGADSREPCAEIVRLSQGSRRVWTVRMLEALARGNEGRKWHTLIDKVWSPQALETAVKTVTARKGAAGVDGQTTEAFAKSGAEEIAVITRLLREGRYEPRPVKRRWIEKPGSKDLRPLGIPTVRDRVVQSALLYVMEPIFEIGFAEHSYGFRPGRSARQAVERVESAAGGRTHLGGGRRHQRILRQHPAGSTAGPRPRKDRGRPHSCAAGEVPATRRHGDRQRLAADGKREHRRGRSSARCWPTSISTRSTTKWPGRGREMIRYADDFVILCRTEAEAQEALAEVQAWMAAAGLTLHPEKTRIVDATVKGGFDFLGWHFERGYRWPREKSQERFKDAIRQQTGRSDGRSLEGNHPEREPQGSRLGKLLPGRCSLTCP